MAKKEFFYRDASWLSFNERVLMEAADASVPLLERLKFLSIYSSNLDEFYRVRMPVLLALNSKDELEQAGQRVLAQQAQFGRLLTEQLIPGLRDIGVHIVYNEPIPEAIRESCSHYFFSTIAAYVEILYIGKNEEIFPENNKLYIAVDIGREGKDEIAILNIPSDGIPRFYHEQRQDSSYVVFIDDIIRDNLQWIFPRARVNGAWSLKVTRDAELNLEDEYEGDLADKIEKKLSKRNFGLASRLLYQPGLPPELLRSLVKVFNLSKALIIEGGAYHNLKDLLSIPIHLPAHEYPRARTIEADRKVFTPSLLDEIRQKDMIVHTPYHSYNTLFRYFNEAAIDEEVEEIYVTMYRVASDSRIIHSLMSAARNGKKVTVFIELKARFDEANNLKWAKAMKAAGVRIINSIPYLKVHAKIALVKRRREGRVTFSGLFATGNFNENTARFYTDHILLTTHHGMTRELELLFIFLTKRRKPRQPDEIVFDHLLVSQFNLQQQFLAFIDREIAHAQAGRRAEIFIKINNLEEQVLIARLYEASNAGVRIRMIVRSVCCLIPGVPGMSENITVRRIVDRYLEHGRIFIFHNDGQEAIWLGSADWMNRNIYRRIEVCFPVHDEEVRQQIRAIVALQLRDNAAAVWLDAAQQNHRVEPDAGGEVIRSQEAIYQCVLENSYTSIAS